MNVSHNFEQRSATSSGGPLLMKLAVAASVSSQTACRRLVSSCNLVKTRWAEDRQTESPLLMTPTTTHIVHTPFLACYTCIQSPSSSIYPNISINQPSKIKSTPSYCLLRFRGQKLLICTRRWQTAIPMAAVAYRVPGETWSHWLSQTRLAVETLTIRHLPTFVASSSADDEAAIR